MGKTRGKERKTVPHGERYLFVLYGDKVDLVGGISNPDDDSFLLLFHDSPLSLRSQENEGDANICSTSRLLRSCRSDRHVVDWLDVSLISRLDQAGEVEDGRKMAPSPRSAVINCPSHVLLTPRIAQTF